ncbi:MAG: triose-phosphate isomerase [Geminicoccaceae bacterium]
MVLAKPVVIGNWKMNGLRADGRALARALLEGCGRGSARGTLGICPPATLLVPLAEVLEGGPILLGAQDCARAPEGAFTGDLGAPMLKDAGAQLVIAGHSERRHGHGEDDRLVRAKAEAALAAGLMVIVCIGETEAEWQAQETIAILDRQLESSLPERASADDLIVAYEPVWAIGTGRTPGADDIRRTHDHLRRRLGELVSGGEEARLLYGGSVKAKNASEIMALPQVDGVLVGGASLDADGFLAIYRAGQGATA